MCPPLVCVCNFSTLFQLFQFSKTESRENVGLVKQHSYFIIQMSHNYARLGDEVRFGHKHSLFYVINI